MHLLMAEGGDLGKEIVFFFNKKNLAEQFYKHYPFFYDKGKIWWLWDYAEYRWKQVDETDLFNYISKASNANTISSTDKSEIIESLKQVGRMHLPKEFEKTWIQFKDTIVDFKTGDSFEACPDYFSTNPIPWKTNGSDSTPNMDRIFTEWVGEKNVMTLYQILAYCLVSDYPIHRIFCFYGEGLNGKSKFIQLLKRFIGEENVTATELDSLINSRFEVTRLYKKLACLMTETNFEELERTSVLKKLTGQDTIGFEYKNKNPFEGINYAKLLIATNNLPPTTDKSIGFYRRWLIVDFPNRFTEKKDILAEIPESEYMALATKCLKILKELLITGEFSNEGSIEDRTKRFEDRSNPFEKFWKERIDESDPNANIWKHEFKDKLSAFLQDNRFRQLSDDFISKKMKERNISDGRLTAPFEYQIEGKQVQWRAWFGLKWKI